MNKKEAGIGQLKGLFPLLDYSWSLSLYESSVRMLFDNWQCDQMAGLFVQYLDICNNVNLADSITNSTW